MHMEDAWQIKPEDIRRLRSRLGLSQQQLADQLGVSFATVSRWENGHTKPYRWLGERLRQLDEQVIGDTDRGPSAPTGAVTPMMATPRLDFLAPSDAVRAAAEAEWLAYGYLANPTFATETSLIDPLPHQRIAVYDVMLRQPRLRFLLADDAGAGKTIMSGLYIREMLARQRLQRILIVPPAGLVGNWQQELQTLFRLSFRIVNGSDARSGNPFLGPDSNRVIVSVDTLTGETLRKRIADPDVEPYDLVIFDEAHKLSADREPDGRTRKTKRYRLAEWLVGAASDDEDIILGWSAQHVLLLTATPHMGKDYPFFALWHLLEPEVLSTPDMLERYPDHERQKHYIRRTKEEMVTFEGQRLYPTRVSTTVAYPLAPLERQLYDRTTAYIRETYNRAAGLNRSAARLAMSVFQRRLASSVYALATSLKRRQDMLDQYIGRAENHQLDIAAEQARQRSWEDDPLESMTGDEEASDNGREEHEVAEDRGTSALLASSVTELRSERAEVESLVALAHTVLAQADEAKFQRLRELVRDPRFAGEKLLIFTEHRDTLTYLHDRLEALGFAGRIAHIHGGMPYQEREAQVRRFRQPGAEGGADICLATDAAGEGINLQFCWVMVNYDIPWNPARLEQRMGRIHRYKQTHDPVLIFNLVADNTREGRVLQTLLDKLDRIRQELRSDKVFDVIGRQLAGWSLRDLLLESLDDEALVKELEERVSTGQVAAAIHNQDALLPPSGDVMDQLPAAREQLKREAYHRLLPGYVRHFLGLAAALLGIGWDGDLDREFSFKALKTGALDPLLPTMERYPVEVRNRWTLTKRLDGDAVYFHPGEPVFDVLRAWVAGRYAEEAMRGTVLVDPEAREAYVCHWVLAQVIEGATTGVSRVVETRLLAVRQWADGRGEEVPAEQLFLLQPGNRIPPQWLLLATRAEAQLEDIREFLTQSLTERWLEPFRSQMYQQAGEDWQWVEEGYRALEADLAIQRSTVTQRIRAGESALQGRVTAIRRRQAALDAEKAEAQARILRAPDRLRLEPMTFFAHALVIPAADPAIHAEFTREVEEVAMAVAQSQLEQEGFVVYDVSTPAKAQLAGLSAWPGFDLWARHPDGRDRAVEVKGRATRGTILVSDNEWAKACTLRDRYWLYVVWDCGSTHPYCLPVRDPFGRLLATTQGGVSIGPEAIMQAVKEQDERRD